MPIDESDLIGSEVSGVSSDLDPELQKVLMDVKANNRPRESLLNCDESNEIIGIEVLAVLKGDVDIAGLKRTGLAMGDSEYTVVTGVVAAEDIENVKKNPDVISLKAARPVNPSLINSLPEIRGLANDFSKAFGDKGALDGSGVVVGIIDFGCDFFHDNFRNDDGTTRIKYFWDQTLNSNVMSPQPYNYGREFNSTVINSALQAAGDPYRKLAYQPGVRAHGTHVMDIAAGNGKGSGHPGVAPKAEIIFVQLSANDYKIDESFGNSKRLLEAAMYIFSKAEELKLPCVINMSLGTNSGPHDGRTPAEIGFDNLLSKPGRAIVISAGNSHEKNIHASGQIQPGNTRTLTWITKMGDPTHNDLDLWYCGTGELEATLITPGGKRFKTVRLGGDPLSIKTSGANSLELGKLVHRKEDPLNKSNNINIFLSKQLPAGDWKLELKNVSSADVLFHAWIERDDLGQSQFSAADVVASHTLGSISCGKNTIAVGAYNAAVLGRDLSSFSSEGPTRDGREKPEISAPGEQVRAAASESKTGTVAFSGTSMAAPHVTGAIALLLQAAGSSLPDIASIRSTMLGSARKQPPVNANWDSRYGSGRLDVLGGLSSVLGISVADLILSEENAEKGVTSSSLVILEELLSQIEKKKLRMKLVLELESKA